MPTTISFNFTGGIISPGDLMNILLATQRAGIHQVSFGLRQQLIIQVPNDYFGILQYELKKVDIAYQVNTDRFPNIVSSYPAEEVFIAKTWLGEGVYKDIFDAIDFVPQLKINLSNNHQSFTPLLTGNINWVASASPHFWHVLVRFPRTNVIYEWNQLVYTNDVAAVSKKLETLILADIPAFIDNPNADGSKLFELLMNDGPLNTQPAVAPVTLPRFMLPYYEGFNSVNNHYWLGIYRRNELFDIAFLLDVCELCLATKVGQICSTPWKSLIIKGINQNERNKWDYILGKHQINVRHAANELNFQVEDNCEDGVELKAHLLRFLNRDDVRSFGLCIGIKTRKKSEIFSSILVRKKPLFKIGNLGFFNVYDILCAKNFNPNERTGTIFCKNIFKSNLPEALKRAIVSYYQFQAKGVSNAVQATVNEPAPMPKTVKTVHQCPSCFTVYDEIYGDAEQQVAAGTSFENLPDSWCCPLCENPKEDFVAVAVSKLYAV